VRIDFKSLLRDETSLRWGFLDRERDPCAVVTSRMELVYVNQPCQSIVPADWFAKRCFEVLPTHEALCALHCPTIEAVQTADAITYCEESLDTEDGANVHLGTAVIPLPPAGADSAKAVLMFRLKEPDTEQAAFAARLLSDARELERRLREAGPVPT